MNSQFYPSAALTFLATAALLTGCQAAGGIRVAGVGSAERFQEETNASDAPAEQQGDVSTAPSPAAAPATLGAMIGSPSTGSPATPFLQVSGNVPLINAALSGASTRTGESSLAMVIPQPNAASRIAATTTRLLPSPLPAPTALVLAAGTGSRAAGAVSSIGGATGVPATTIPALVEAASPVANAVAIRVANTGATQGAAVATLANAVGDAANGILAAPVSTIAGMPGAAAKVTAAVSPAAAPVFMATVTGAATATVRLPTVSPAVRLLPPSPTGQTLAPPSVSPVLGALRHSRN